MKKFRLNLLRSGLASLALLTFGLSASAEAITLENKMMFDINPDTKEAVVTGLIAYALLPDVAGEVVIPDEVEWEGVSYKVVAIGTNACCNNNCLKNLYLGNNVKEIQPNALYNSSELVSITFPEGFTTIGNEALKNCPKLIADLNFPSTLTTIGNLVFQGATFTDFEIPASVTTLGDNPFVGCAKLGGLTVAAGNKNFEIKDGALLETANSRLITFPDTTGITEFTVPDGIKICGGHLLENNSKITEITIPSGLEAIGDYAFSNMPALTSLNIPASVDSIGAAFITKSRNIQTLSIEEGGNFVLYDNTVVCTKDLSRCMGSLAIDGVLELPKELEVIDEYCFHGYTGMTGLKAPGVKSVGKAALASCSNLKDPEFGALEYLGFNAFNGASHLGKLVLPSTLRIIDGQAFCYAGLTEIVMPEGLDSIGSMAFYGCNSLTEVTIPGTARMAASTFYACNNLSKATFAEGFQAVPRMCFAYDNALTEVVLPESLKAIGGFAFIACRNLSKMNIPAGLELIDEGAFEFIALEEVTMPEKITSVYPWVFTSMPNLKTLKLHDGITRIEDHGIHGNEELTDLVLPKYLEYVGPNGLSVNHSIETLTFPETMKEYGEYCLNGNTAMTDMYVLATTPVTMEYDFFDPEAYADAGYNTVTLHVPEGCIEAYEEAEIWNKFVNIVDDLPNPGSGIRDLNNGKLPIRERLYDLNGVEVTQQVFGQVYIRKMEFADGTVKSIPVLGE